MYNNPYYNNQDNLTRIDNQIKELENMRNHLQRPQPSINQTFQLAPSQTGVRFSDSLESVAKELVFADSVFFSKDFSTLWLKDVKGGIRTFKLEEEIKKDDKDIEIENLKEEIKKLKKEMSKNAKSSSTDDDELSTEPVEN